MIKERTMAKLELAIILIMTFNFASSAAFIYEDYLSESLKPNMIWFSMVFSAIYLIVWLRISNFVKRGLAVDI